MAKFALVLNRETRIGRRRFRATIKQHNDVMDEHGNPTLSEENDWTTLIEDWPIQFVRQTEDEKSRGRQVSDQTTHMIVGEYHGGSSVTSEMQCVINGTTYEILAIYDPDNMQRELIVELKQE